MEIGYIGLGKMGANMTARLLGKGHRVTVFDVDAAAVRRAKRRGAKAAGSLEELVAGLSAPRTVWIMVPHAHVDGVIAGLRPYLRRGDTVIDGGNSPFGGSIARAAELKKAGIRFLDVGVSGGPGGARNGACLMIGGAKADFGRYRKLFRDLSVKDGFAHMGPAGAGHFTKMVHNGIEYGMMQSLAEGFDLLRARKDLRVDLQEAARVYAHGSVISSSLVEWLGDGLRKFGVALDGVSGRAAESGEGRWTVKEARRLGVPVRTIKDAFDARKRSQRSPNYQGKLIMAMRNAFGGHDPNPPRRKRRISMGRRKKERV